VASRKKKKKKNCIAEERRWSKRSEKADVRVENIEEKIAKVGHGKHRKD